MSGDLALCYILISYENSSHKRRPIPFRPLSFLGFIFAVFLILSGQNVKKKASPKDS